MKLYMVPLAPNPTKVMLYIAERFERGVDLGVEEIMVNTVKGHHKRPDHLSRNPFGTLPVLELEDHTHFIESLTIVLYFEKRFPENTILPQDVVRQVFALELERIVDLRIANHMGRYAHATKSPLGRPSDPVIARSAELDLEPALDYIEDLLSDGRPFLTGKNSSLADFTLQASCQFLRFIEADLFGNREKLREWDKNFRSTPAAQAVLKW